MTKITLPDIVDLAAADSVRSQFVSAAGDVDQIDGKAARQIGMSALQVLASIMKFNPHVIIDASPELREVARLAKLDSILFAGDVP